MYSIRSDAGMIPTQMSACSEKRGSKEKSARRSFLFLLSLDPPSFCIAMTSLLFGLFDDFAFELSDCESDDCDEGVECAVRSLIEQNGKETLQSIRHDPSRPTPIHSIFAYLRC